MYKPNMLNQTTTIMETRTVNFEVAKLAITLMFALFTMAMFFYAIGSIFNV